MYVSWTRVQDTNTLSTPMMVSIVFVTPADTHVLVSTPGDDDRAFRDPHGAHAISVVTGRHLWPDGGRDDAGDVRLRRRLRDRGAVGDSRFRSDDRRPGGRTGRLRDRAFPA